MKGENMDEKTLKALQIAKNNKQNCKVNSCYDYGDFFYFGYTNKNGEEVNGPCIDKETLKQIHIDSCDLLLLEPIRKIEIEKYL